MRRKRGNNEPTDLNSVAFKELRNVQFILAELKEELLWVMLLFTGRIS